MAAVTTPSSTRDDQHDSGRQVTESGLTQSDPQASSGSSRAVAPRPRATARATATPTSTSPTPSSSPVRRPSVIRASPRASTGRSTPLRSNLPSRAGSPPVGSNRSVAQREERRSTRPSRSSTSPVGATISTTRRRPPRSSSACTTRSTEEATVGTTNAESMLRPASSGRVHSLVSASRALFACSEHIPGIPELSAMSRSSDSASRTSPTTSRSGRIRSASLMSRRSVTSPVPSRLGCRHCIATVSALPTASSKVSSTVTIRSSVAARREQRAEQRRLAALGRAGDQDVAPAAHARRAGTRRPGW